MINSKNLRNKAVILVATVAIPTITKLWPCHPHYNSNFQSNRKRTKNNKDMFLNYIIEKQLFSQSPNYIVLEILTRGIKMSSHFNFWTACPTFKWSANLVNYHRLVRCNVAMRIIHDPHLKRSCTQPNKCSVAFKSQNDTHFF